MIEIFYLTMHNSYFMESYHRSNRLTSKGLISMGKLIAIVNNKGGVGKTTTAVSLSHALGLRGHPSLVIDLDSQCNSSSFLVDPEMRDDTLFELLEGSCNNIDLCIYQTKYKNLYCLPNAEETSGLELELIEKRKYNLLREVLSTDKLNKYEYIFLDCPPNLLFFVLSALYCSEFVIVPINSSSKYAIEGLSKVIDLVTQISNSENPNLKFLKLLINSVDKRTSISKIVIDKVYKIYGEKLIFKTLVPRSTAFEMAEYVGKPIIHHAPSSTGARAYRRLADEMTEILPPNGE